MKSIIVVFFGMIFFVFSFTGCAGSADRIAADNRLDESGKSGTISQPSGDAKKDKKQRGRAAAAPVAEKTTLDEQEDFEIISTPFGYVKRKKKPVDQAAVAPVPEKQPISAPNVSAPVSPPPAVSDEDVPAAPAVPEAEPDVLPAPEAEPAVPLSGEEEEDLTPILEVEPSASEDLPPWKRAGRNIPEETGQISFDFDDAELASVIRVMADFLRINYLIDPGVSGKVTIHTAGQLEAADVFPIFYQTLEVNGLTAVKEGNVYRVLKLKDASRMPLASRLIGNQEAIPPEERVILQIIPLKFISAQEVAKLITPFVSADGTIVSEGSSNTLLVVDKGINIFKITKLVEVFDVSLFEKASYRVYTLQNADAEEVSKTLGEVMPAPVAGAKDEVKFIPIKWLNSLLIVSSSPDVFDQAETLIRQLDVSSEGAQPQIYVYSVKNGMAVDLGDTLKAIFGVKVENVKKTERESVSANPFAKGSRDKDTSVSAAADKPEATVKSETTARPEATTRTATTATGTSATLRGEIRITDDPIRNVLIIEAVPGDYKIVKNILERLDVLPRQVLIDVIIAEISLGEGTELGIEWTFKKADWTDAGSLAATIGGSGLQYTRGLSEKWQGVLHALANDNKLNIISSPSVLASDNKQARIDVTTEVPIPSTNYTYVTDGDNVLETNVEYRDTGVILDVTPHINEYGLVTMDISQEVSNVGSLIKVAGQDYYSFDTRNILTSLTVQHNQSIVIGGLISKKKNDAASGVPWLVKIPIIRWLSGTEKKTDDRSELIVMITPRVITSLEDVDAVSEEFKKKIEGVQAVFK